MTVFEMAKKLMKDKDFLMGGISLNERKWADAVGFEYTVKDGCIYNTGEDMTEFYKAMATLLDLEKKYSK